jgi:prevent-host-death family protein
MDVSIMELRKQPTRFIKIANEGTDVVITNRGKPLAKLVPVVKPVAKQTDNRGFLFGLWADHDDVGDVKEYVRNLRRGRQF